MNRTLTYVLTERKGIKENITVAERYLVVIKSTRELILQQKSRGIFEVLVRKLI